VPSPEVVEPTIVGVISRVAVAFSPVKRFYNVAEVPSANETERDNYLDSIL